MKSPGGLLAAGLMAAVIVGIVLAARQLEMPSTVHAQHLDSMRIQRLSQAQSQVESFTRASNHLPAQLQDLWAENPYSRDNFLDPDTGAPLEYHATRIDTYELCATFSTASGESAPFAFESNWKHPAGHFCFVRHAKASQAPPGVGLVGTK